MPADWLVIQIDEGADQGTVKLLASADEAQQYLAATVAGGVPKEQLLLFHHNSSVDFAVAYQPIVKIASAPDPPPPNPQDGPDTAPEKSAQSEPQGVQNGVRLSSLFNPD